MNDFLKEKYNLAISRAISNNYKGYIDNYFKILDELEINNEEALRKFHYLCQYIPPILNKIYSNSSKEIKASITGYCFKNAKDASFEEILNNIIEAFSVYKFVKVAYPSTGSDVEMIGEKYNIDKWMKALNDIYIRARLFGNKQEAVNYITSKWDNMDEKIDFERWIKYYEQGGASLYKSAQGIPMLPLQAVPGLNIKNVPVYDNSEVQEKKDPDKKEEIRNIRTKIIGRINSAKKLLTNQYGMEFAGQDYNKLLRMLLDLERDLLSIKTAALLEDVLYRAKNRMEKSGCDENAIQLFIKIAQLPPLGDVTQTQMPQAEQTEKAQDPEKGKESLQSFIESLKEVAPKATTENVPKDITETSENPTEVKTNAPAQRTGKTTVASWANINTNEFIKFKKVANSIETIIKETKNHLYVVAQLAAPETIPTPAPAPAPAPGAIPAPAEAKEVAETTEEVKPKKKKDEKIVPEQGISTKELLNIDTDPIEDALKNVKLPEVIDRLQALSRVFKNREVARQLAIIDLMLDRLGISGFFPSLAEATRSALESNQYCQSRIEEILAKLISATDEIGQSLLYQTQTSKPDNIVDKEMEKYIGDEEKSKEEDLTSAPVPVSAPAPAMPAAKSPTAPPVPPTVGV